MRDVSSEGDMISIKGMILTPALLLCFGHTTPPEKQSIAIHKPTQCSYASAERPVSAALEPAAVFKCAEGLDSKSDLRLWEWA